MGIHVGLHTHANGYNLRRSRDAPRDLATADTVLTPARYRHVLHAAVAEETEKPSALARSGALRPFSVLSRQNVVYGGLPAYERAARWLNAAMSSKRLDHPDKIQLILARDSQPEIKIPRDDRHAHDPGDLAHRGLESVGFHLRLHFYVNVRFDSEAQPRAVKVDAEGANCAGFLKPANAIRGRIRTEVNPLAQVTKADSRVSGGLTDYFPVERVHAGIFLRATGFKTALAA